jgi:hypothetical protein
MISRTFERANALSPVVASGLIKVCGRVSGFSDFQRSTLVALKTNQNINAAFPKTARKAW